MTEEIRLVCWEETETGEIKKKYVDVPISELAVAIAGQYAFTPERIFNTPDARHDIRYRIDMDVLPELETFADELEQEWGKILPLIIGEYLYLVTKYSSTDDFEIQLDEYTKCMFLTEEDKNRLAEYIREHAPKIGKLIFDVYKMEATTISFQGFPIAIELRVYDNQELDYIKDLVELVAIIEKRLEEQVNKNPTPLKPEDLAVIAQTYVGACLYGYQYKPPRRFIQILERALGIQLKPGYPNMEELLKDIIRKIAKGRVREELAEINRKRQEHIRRTIKARA